MLSNDPNGVAVPHFFIGDETFSLCRVYYGHSQEINCQMKLKYTTTGYVEGKEL